MINKITRVIKNNVFLIFAFVLFFSIKTNAQIITSVKNGSTILPLFTGPGTGPGGIVSQRCYTPALDPQPPQPANPFKYYSDFIISSAFPAATVFTLQFSDANGSFASPTFLSNTPTFSGSTGTFSFLLPSTTYGTGYRLRVINTANTSSATSAAVPSYYIPFLGTFYLQNNRVNNVSICGGGTFNLFVDPANISLPGDPVQVSPATYTNLKYRWVRNGVLIPNETESSITINQSGVYYAYVDYGICNPVSAGKPTTSSIDVTVNIVPGGSTFNITGNPIICPPTLNPLTVTAGYSYQWFKDGVALAGETAFTYNAAQPGNYTVLVNQGTCANTSKVFNVSAVGFTASIDVDLLPDVNIIGAGEPKSITITSSATAPTYQWYLNNVLIPTAVLPTYNATQAGKYKAVVNQTSGCLVSQEFLFELKEGVNPKEIPNLISPNNDGKNDTWILPSTYGNLNTEVQIVSATGQTVLQTKNYQNDWPTSTIDFKSVNPVFYYTITKEGGDVKKGSITIIK